jgi:glycosyltransferase involved in cell wall biosynthesis
VHIGIVMPAWNVAPWIGDAIASVLSQSHRNWTLVVVDDGSTDATATVVAGFKDPRIQLIQQVNAGVSAARNRGMLKLDSDALLFLDADDWLAADALARLHRTLDAAPQAVAAAGAHAFVSTDHMAARSRRPPSGDILERLLTRNCFVNGGQLLLRRAAVRIAGGFAADVAYGEDWEYWVRIALLGPFTVVAGNAPLLFVRQRPGGAYHRLASDPAAFVPCMNAIFANPALLARFGAMRLSAIRERTEAENAWIIGRELIRHGRAGHGLGWLRRSVRAKPTLKRVALLSGASLLPLLPGAMHGPFRVYPAAPQTAQLKRTQ